MQSSSPATGRGGGTGGGAEGFATGGGGGGASTLGGGNGLDTAKEKEIICEHANRYARHF